jgi:hypothetical protein
MKSTHKRIGFWKGEWTLGVICIALSQCIAAAAPPVVKTVPWVASNPLIPHTTYNAKVVTLKGTCDQQGAELQYIWDFGDGSAVATGTVGNKYVIEAKHAYTGADGQIFTAQLTVQNTSTGETGNKAYYVMTKTKALDIEANVAIDEGLWYLHKTQYRRTSGGVDYGDWTQSVGYGNYATLSSIACSAANLNAFEVNGHLENGNDSNPYKETVARTMKSLFTWLSPRTTPAQQPGSRNPENSTPPNNNGLYVGQGHSYYQGGMVMDAIVASGTPNAVATTGDATWVKGRTYKDILQDMVDDHAAAQYDGANSYGILGGWRYNYQDYPDNSACQWSAIGILAAVRNWGCILPAWVIQYNVNWLAYSQDSTGGFGYDRPSYYPWGPYAVTPSGMVQMVMDGIGRGMNPTGKPNWDKAETFIRDRFAYIGDATTSLKGYYYGMFSFTKSMLLYPYDGDEDPLTSDPTPIKWLRSQTAGVVPLDWYGAEVSQGAPTDGVARTLINGQTLNSSTTSGYWSGHDYTGEQYYFETAWAIMMLHRTVFESGAPVAVGKCIPNPGIVGQLITLDGSDSYHQDASRSIIKWEWDLDSDGVFDAVGPFANATFSAVGSYPIKLRVTDDGNPARVAETIVIAIINTPPLPPTADADGPYIFCPGQNWFLDGRKSVNPDEGQHQPGSYPGDTIQEYAWDLNGDTLFDIYGPTPDVTAYFTAMGEGTYLVTLRVTDTTSQSYPSSGMPDLSSTTTAQVFVKSASDPDCGCVTLTATPALKKVVLTWTVQPTAHHYNLYRGLTPGGPYSFIGSVAASVSPSYEDAPGVLNQVYYYVVRPAKINDDEICQSNEVSAEPLHPVPVVTVTPVVMSNTGKYFYKLGLTSQSFGRNQCPIYVQDTGTGQIEGPYAVDYVLYIRTGMPSHSVKPGVDPVKAFLLFKGSAKIWAEDPIGQKSDPPILIP